MKDKKFSTVETILALLITIPLDILELVSGGIISAILWIINIPVWFIFFLWFWLKGGKYVGIMIRLTVWLLANLLEVFPILSILPWRTIALMVSIKMINSPKEDEEEGEEGGEGESELEVEEGEEEMEEEYLEAA